MTARLPRAPRALALALLLTTVVACGGGNGKVPAKAASDASSAASESATEAASESEAEAPADPSDPCSLLSRSEAEQAIGSKLKSAPKEEDDPRDPGTKGSANTPSDATRAYAIDVFEETDSGEAFVESAQSDGTGLEFVGDKAVYDEAFHRVYVVAGDVAFAVVFLIGDLDDEQAVGTRIAKLVVGNLP
jgi:hypothetical protein